jgi:hypothetical protein
LRKSWRMGKRATDYSPAASSICLAMSLAWQ